ncbi:MAG TPA: hypothetical protein VKU39_11190, partial [Streptosporangiaceae bacterium]|nr:hypothetical protein [Streptosporangiaceae bacterium]
MDEEQLRHMLTEATAYEPPLGAVVDRAVHAGIRMRRRRRVMTIAGSTAAVAVVALVPALARVASPPLRPAVPHQRPVPGSRHPAMPGG